MSTFSPELLAAWTGGEWTTRPPTAITGFCIDSRQLRTGEVFVAIKTDKRDGHDYLPAAMMSGASAALVSRVNPALSLPQLVVPDPLLAFQSIAREHRRTFHRPVIGISGSAGKTSTKNLLALLLGGGGFTAQAEVSGEYPPKGVLATEGNLNNHLGVPLTLTRIDPTLHAFAVIEAGIGGPGEMAPLAAMIEPDVALITLVAPAHTAELGGLEGVANEKAILPASVRPTGVAIFPKQCTEFAAFRDLAVQKMVVERADVIRPTEPPRDKVFFTITHRDSATVVALAYGRPPPLTFTFRRVSDGMAQNAALAICAALWLGVPHAAIQMRLANWQPARLRGELRHDGRRLLYLDCYNANPASMADALDAFYGVAPANDPRLFVLGGMEELGSESENYHRALGRALKLRPHDAVILIGDHASAVRAGFIERYLSAKQIEIATSLDVIAARVANWRGAVFIKGSRRYALEKVIEAGAVVHKAVVAA